MIPAKEIDGELWIRAADARIKEAAELRLQMDLRDYFAARAMQSTFYPAILESIRIDQDLDCDKVAEFAYTMADAMLSERMK